MDVNEPDSLWRASSAEEFSAEALADYLYADLVVIGGGYTGLNAALEAAKRGAKVVLVEAHKIGHGASGRNVGLCNAGLWLPPEQISEVLGSTMGEKLSAVLAAAPDTVYGLIDQHAIQCEPVRKGTLHCAHSKRGLKELQERVRQMTAIGAPVTLLDADEARERTGAQRVYGALFDPRAGTIQPMAYAKGLARAAVEAGALVFEETPALSLSWEDEKWEIATPAGVVRASAMLMATNATPYQMSWINQLRSVHVNYFQAATEPLSPELRAQILAGEEGCWDTAPVMSSWRLDQAGRLIIGGMGQLDHVASGVHRLWLRRKLRRLYPALAGVEFAHIWQGTIAMTDTKLPKIWRFGPRGYACFGYSGRGIGPGTVFGQHLAVTLLSGDEGLLPIAPVNANIVRAPVLRASAIEAGATLYHFVSDRF